MNRLRIRRSISAFLVTSLAVLPMSPAPQAGAADWAPKEPPSKYPMNAGWNAVRSDTFITDVCTTDTQLDCVESVAAYLGNQWVSGTPGDISAGELREWTIPGVVNLSGSSKVIVGHVLKYTGNVLLQTTVNAPPANGVFGDRDELSLPRDVKFRATVRTSWVLPTHVSGKSIETAITVEKLATSGASRITLEGIPITYMIVNDRSTLTSPTGKGAYEVRTLSMTVSDGRYAPVKKDCIEKPTIMTSENGYGHPLPTYSNGNLDLKVEAPHFRSDGVTKHIGVYEARIPLETATCLWGETIKDASSLVVEVIETDGSTKTATTSIDVTADAVVIKASGFTFSTPTIRVKSTTSTAAPAVTKPAKPKGVRTATSKGSATVSFTRVKGLTYSAVAVKGKTKKTLRCTLGKTRVTCKATKLAKGRWKVTVTPKKGSVKGTVYSKTLSVK
jgi:hypothetical protein